MAVLASISLSSYAAADEYGLEGWITPPETASRANVTVVTDEYFYDNRYAQTGPVNLTFMPAAGFDNSRAYRLYVSFLPYFYPGVPERKGDIYATMKNSPYGNPSNGDYYFCGLGGQTKHDGSFYIRSVGDAACTGVGNVLGIDYGSTVTGNVYLGFANPQTTYSGVVYAVMNSTVQGTSKLEIASGTFTGVVAVGHYTGWSAISTILGGPTELKITGGKFACNVVAGCVTSPGVGTATINNGTNLVIKGGTFEGPSIVAGNSGTGISTINGGANTTITGGTFKTTIYGGSAGGGADTINGGIDVTLSDGTFETGSKVYALGNSGRVNGAVTLTIGNDAKFSGDNIISVGDNGSVDYSGVTSSTLTLKDITGTSSLASVSSIQVDGGKQDSTLVMDNVHTTIKARLSRFSSMQVKSSDLTLDNSNANLGGVKSISIDGKSTLNLSGTNANNVQMSVEDGATLNITGGSLAMKEGDLFTGQGRGSISISGATLKAEEGNWTLNKEATVDVATITGSHEVSFGSEVNSSAVVTMSGDIDATKGHLVLKNTAVAAGKTATLSGDITFEGIVQNSGFLAFGNNTIIHIDEESLIRNAHFKENGEQSANGFLIDKEVCVATGGAYQETFEGLNLKVKLNEAADMTLSKRTENGVTSLYIIGFAEMEEKTYFVREGEVTYTRIIQTNEAKIREIGRIAVGDDGVSGDHMLVLDSTWDNKVMIESESDFAQVSVNEGVVLNASKTAVNGESNELHVIGKGTVLMDAPGKLGQLSGTATMKVAEDTTFDGTSEAKMTGVLEVADKKTLTVNETGKETIASFSTVKLGSESTLASNVAADTQGTIQALGGSGTLDKTGTGTLAISGDSSGFSGDVKVGAGMLEVHDNMNAATLSGSGKLAKTGKGDMKVANAQGFTGDIEVSGGTLQLERVNHETAKTQKVSVSGQNVSANLMNIGSGTDVVLKELDISRGGTFGVYINGTAVAGDKDTNVGRLTLADGNKIVIGSGGGTLEANLVTTSGSILDFSSGALLTMGCDLTLAEGTRIVLSEDNFDTLQRGGSVTLFTSIDTPFDMDDASRLAIYRGRVDAEMLTGQVSFHTDAQGYGTLSTPIPEPATSTLSLLALAGLMARRRRK